MKNIAKSLPLELLFFTAALCWLYFINPLNQHFTLCPLGAMRFTFCPGCGIGRSIYYIMHGNFSASWKMHPLGLFAFCVIISRLITLSRITYQKLNTQNYE